MRWIISIEPSVLAQRRIVTSGGALGGHAWQVVTAVVASVIAAVIIAIFKIGSENEVSNEVSIDGPTTVQMTSAGVAGFRLTAHASGDPESAYWIDNWGDERDAPTSNTSSATFLCHVGEVTVTFTAVYSDGSTERASHAVKCGVP